MSDLVMEGFREVVQPKEQYLSFAVTLMEHLMVPTFVLDAESRVLIWNRACERLTGVPASEVVGTQDHWKAFYESARPCLADLVVKGEYAEIAELYTVHEEPGQPVMGVHGENWCWMPRRGERLYLAIDAGPVYDEQGKLIAVVETLNDITARHVAQARAAEQVDMLKAHYAEHQREAELARRILEGQIRKDLLDRSGVRYSVSAAGSFSGDLVLAARSPQGKLYALLADATGHGLVAAVSVLPMVQEFYRLVEHSCPLGEMVESINFLLTNSLPVGRFVAAGVVVLDEAAHQGEIWIGGLPDASLINHDGEFIGRFESRDLPLGIGRSPDMASRVERFDWEQSCRLVLVSDGIVEATNAAGEYFGEEGLLEAVRGTSGGDDLVGRLQQAVDKHRGGRAARDDFSILVLGGSTEMIG